MRFVPENHYLRSNEINKVYYPITVNTICPYCKRLPSFSLNFSIQGNGMLEYCRSNCPACTKQPLFIYVLKPITNRNATAKFTGDLYINPGSTIRTPLKNFDTINFSDDRIKNNYLSALNVYNIQEWNATAIICRKVLEGITKTLTNSEQNKTLAKQLEDLPKQMNLGQTIMSMADMLRLGGNLAAHYDTEIEPNEIMTTMMIDFLEYLIEYLFILPEKINHLKDQINGSINE